MLIDFFYTLRAAKLPVSVKEYLTLLEALQVGRDGPQVGGRLEPGRFLPPGPHRAGQGREALRQVRPRFRRLLQGRVEMVADFTKEIPADWLRKILENELTPEQKAAIEKMGWDELMETLKKRLEEQKRTPRGAAANGLARAAPARLATAATTRRACALAVPARTRAP